MDVFEGDREGMGSVGTSPAPAYRTPDHRGHPIAEVLERILQARRVVLTTHVNADGDGIGCQVALADWLSGYGIEARIVNPTPFPDTFRFLVPATELVGDAASDEGKVWCHEADLAVVVDTGEQSRLARVKPLIDHLPKIVVDHHPPGASPIEGLTLLDSGACAAGELVLDILLASGKPLGETAVRGLYVAILTDTGSFRFSNTTPSCHRMAADLVELGADPAELHREVYGSPPLRHYELLREALGLLEVDEPSGVAWMTVPTATYERLGADPSDLEGFVDFPRSIEGVEVGILFRQIQDERVKVSFRSNRTVDVNILARRFGGGGHARAAGAVVPGRLGEVRQRVVAETIDLVRRDGGQAAGAGGPSGGNDDGSPSGRNDDGSPSGGNDDGSPDVQ